MGVGTIAESNAATEAGLDVTEILHAEVPAPPRSYKFKRSLAKRSISEALRLAMVFSAPITLVSRCAIGSSTPVRCAATAGADAHVTQAQRRRIPLPTSRLTTHLLLRRRYHIPATHGGQRWWARLGPPVDATRHNVFPA